VWQINSTWKGIARKTSKFNCTFSRNKTIRMVSLGSNIAESHYLSFLITDKQDLQQISRAGLQNISTELL